MNSNFDPSTIKSYVPNNRLPEITPRNYLPPIDDIKNSVDISPFFKKIMDGGNFMMKQVGNNNPFGVKPL
jgi:hypothetical protein